jgi:hypothetical protein
MADQTFAVHCGFFDAINSDRTYSADEMNRPYKRVISNGVFATPNGTPSTDLQVTASSGMNIICKKGEGLFGDKWFENPSGIAITVPSNTGTVPRIDSVLVQVDTRTSGRVGNIVYRTGTPASSPVPPAINQVEGVVEYRLANIRVNAGVSAITQSMITDRRGSSDCPWVTSLIYQVDTSTLYDQWEAAYEEYFEDQKQAWDEWYSHLTEELDVSMTLDRDVNTVTTAAQTTGTIPIGIAYNHSTDILEVYINGLRAIEGTHYVVVDDTSIQVENQLDIGQTVTFVVIRSVIGGGSAAGYVTPEIYGAKGDGVTDDSTALNSAIASGKPVHLDGSKTYAIASMVSILNDCVIFGNGATILENGFESTHLIEANDCNLTIHDLIIEGDPASEHVITGITIYSCVSQLNNLVVKNVTSHSIVISDGKAVLSDIIMNNVGQKGNYSFVYLTDNSETNWNNVFAFNDVLDTAPQCFYISSGHHTISNVQVYNTRVLVDARNGSTTVTNGYCYNTCGVVCQTSGYNEGANITIANVVFDNVIGFNNTNTLINIRVCKNLTLKDCIMIVSESATNASFLMRFEKPSDLSKNVDRVLIDNLNIIGDGIVTNGIYAKDTLASDIIFKNCQFPVLSNGSAYVVVTYGTDLARFIFENCTFKNKTNNLYVYDNVGKAPYENVIVRSRYKQRGTTAERPVLWRYYESNIYYDTDLSKLILWNGTAWVNLDGTAL